MLPMTHMCIGGMLPQQQSARQTFTVTADLHEDHLVKEPMMHMHMHDTPSYQQSASACITVKADLHEDHFIEIPTAHMSFGLQQNARHWRPCCRLLAAHLQCTSSHSMQVRAFSCHIVAGQTQMYMIG